MVALIAAVIVVTVGLLGTKINTALQRHREQDRPRTHSREGGAEAERLGPSSS